MSISVIIPTLNAGKTIYELLSKLRSQSLDTEIIVIDSSSKDNTVNIAKSFGVKVISIPSHAFNHGRTRNLGATESKGDVLVFMTQDAIPQNNYLIKNLIAPLKDPSTAASYARHIPRKDASPSEIFARNFNYPDTSLIKDSSFIQELGIKTFFFSNSCSAIKRRIFFEAGLFPENVKSNEDMIIAAKIILMGYKIAYISDATVIHSHIYSFSDLFKRYYNIGSSLKRNSWIFRYAKAEKEGLRFLIKQSNFIIKNYGFKYIPNILIEAIVKYMGYKIGLFLG